MTIVVVGISSEGVAMAADSRTTEVVSSSHRRVASESAQKLFLCGNAGIATYGLGVIDRRTIGSLMIEWDAEREGTETLDALAESLGDFFYRRLPTPRTSGAYTRDQWPLGFLLAGFEERGVGRVIEVRVSGAEFKASTIVATAEEPSVAYRGQTSAIRRLLRGVDLTEMRSHRMDVPDELGQRLETLQYRMIGPTTTQDAVDLACFLVQTTIVVQRFTDGTLASGTRDGRGPIPGCGGAVQALTVTSRGVDWVLPPKLTAPRDVLSDVD